MVIKGQEATQVDIEAATVVARRIGENAYQEWLGDSFEGGARRAHQHVKGGARWMPPEVNRGGVPVYLLGDVVQAIADEWSSVWQAEHVKLGEESLLREALDTGAGG